MNTIDEHLSFSLSMLRALSPSPESTLCWSPYSVAANLCLAATLARSATRDELVSALTGGPRGDLDQHVQDLAASAVLTPARSHPQRPNDPSYVLNLSNTLWVESNLALHPQLDDEQVGPMSGSAIRRAPFARSPSQSRDTINLETARQTNGLVPELLSPSEIDQLTVAALISTLYLRTSWVTPFRPPRPGPAPFATPHGNVYAPMMRANARMGYGERDGWRIVDIPALGGISATVLLPTGEPLWQVEPKLNGHVLGTLLDHVSPQQVMLSMPRLHLDSRPTLNAALQALGIRSLFNGTCDLTGLADAPMCVSHVGHQAVLRVDERGIEGAAATSMVMTRSSSMQPPVTVTVDRPFLLLIRRNAAVFFLARVTDPGRTPQIGITASDDSS